MTRQEVKEARRALNDGRTNSLAYHLTKAVEHLESTFRVIDQSTWSDGGRRSRG